MYRIYPGPGLLLAAAVALSVPAFAQERLNTATPDTEAGLLLPAIQKIHEKPSGSSQTPAGHKNLKPGTDTNPRGLLLPAVQKAHDAPQQPSQKPGGQTRIKPGHKSDPRGLLLPAVQKAHSQSPPADQETQFKIRTGSSDVPNAEATRSGVQKKKDETQGGVIQKVR